MSANLMVGVRSGSKRFHALGVLARWVSETTSSCLKGKVGGCWGRGGRTPPHQHPQSTPLGWRGAVLGIPGKAGSSSHFWFWSFFPGFRSSVSPVELSCSLRAAVSGLTPLSPAATPVASGSLTCALTGAGVRVVTS